MKKPILVFINLTFLIREEQGLTNAGQILRLLKIMPGSEYAVEPTIVKLQYVN